MISYTVSHPTYNGDMIQTEHFSMESGARLYLSVLEQRQKKHAVLRKIEVLSV